LARTNYTQAAEQLLPLADQFLQPNEMSQENGASAGTSSLFIRL
jgi:hypothetical protein